MKKLALILAILFLGSGFIQAQPPSGSQAVAPAKLPTNSNTLRQEPAINSTNTGINVSSDNKKLQEMTGSIIQTVAPKVTSKVQVDNSGSVAPKTEVSKSVVKPVEVKGTSLEEKPVKAVEEKKKITVPESTKTD